MSTALTGMWLGFAVFFFAREGFFSEHGSVAVGFALVWMYVARLEKRK